MDIFNKSFISSVKNILDQNCINGKCMRAVDLCQELNLDPKEYQQLISTMIRVGAVPEYCSYKGPGRGIGRIDTPPTRETRKGASSKFIPDHFLDELEEILERECTVGGPGLPRAKVVDMMETAVSKNSEGMISAALKTERFSNFFLKKGPSGGIFRKNKLIEKYSTKPAQELEINDMINPSVKQNDDADHHRLSLGAETPPFRAGRSPAVFRRTF